jgi:hypothetical protein
MGPYIGSIAMLLAGIIVIGTGRIPTRINLKRDLVQVRLAGLSPEQRILEAHRVWNANRSVEKYTRSSIIYGMLTSTMSNSEIKELIEGWRAEEEVELPT